MSLKKTTPPFDEQRVQALSAALEKRERELAVLSHVASRIHGEENPESILDIALEEILARMDLKTAWVFLGDEQEGKLRLAASRGVAHAYLEQIRENGLDRCLCHEVFWSGHRMQARNTTQCPRMPTIIEGLAAPVAHACIPLRLEAPRRGVLNVAARPGEQFSEDELQFLETLVHQVSLAVERARHLSAERHYNQEARALAALNKAIGGSLDVSEILRAVADTARDVLGIERVHIFLGSDARQMRLAHLLGLPVAGLAEGQVLDFEALGASAFAHSIEAGTPLVVHDAGQDDRVNGELWRRWNFGAGILLPLLHGARTIGFMVLGRTQSHRWTAEQVDVAEALAAQASVALENARLYVDAREAYTRLKDAQAKIIQAEKLAVVGTFASGLAHEVRNPLNSMALQLSLLERRIAPLDTGVADTMREITGIIRDEISRLDGLVGDFLSLSRATRIQFRPASFDTLLDEVVRLLRPEARASNVTLRRQRPGGALPELPLDTEKMKQVLINLVRNAIEAMPKGGVVVVESGLREGQARVVVRDTGPGLPEGMDVFQVFVTTKPGGTGLGLPIAQQIVLEHGGELAASSVPGEGATFMISLPLTATSDGGGV